MEKTTEIRTNIYGREYNYERGQKRLKEWRGSPENKDLIERYQRYLSAKGNTGKQRIYKLTYQLRNICDFLQKNLKDATQQDIEKVIAAINEKKYTRFSTETTNKKAREYSDVTKADYRRAIKTFFNWYMKSDPRLEGSKAEIKTARTLYTYIKEDVKTEGKKPSLNYSDLINDEDVRNLLQKGCDNTQEKAIICILFETGIRVGELLGMRLKDIEFKEKYAMIRVDGKTGQRRIPILRSTPHLTQWLEEHPDKRNNNALLWMSKHNGYYGKPLHYAGIRKLISRVYNKAEVNKRMNPHFFRHSRGTLDAKDYREELLNQKMGWVAGSKMTKVYVHLNAEVVEEEFKKLNGLEAESEKRTPSVVYCVCGSTNDKSSKYCFKCGQPLSIAVVLESEQKRKDAIAEAISMIMTNPEMRAKLEALKTNGG